MAQLPSHGRRPVENCGEYGGLTRLRKDQRRLITESSMILESKIADHPELFTSCSSIRETLGLFLFCHHLLDAPSAVLENDAQLVEAAFGRIKLFGSAARTVLDEPLALKATINYLQEKDPSLVAAAERSMLHSDNPSVHGNMWETLMPPIFVETFKDRPLSYDLC
ncbi:hypothetical protein BC939DRAFT_494164 [Gamsiella multidivaricata]|uniref:uncharacterized protein n=1 Tax=Gamsiella multidivaricata TaxID=101098 RepID=UPI0022206E50|nr:uncharacterized protein BC939DRAFT_494164 [Gamsiella multidivaricata]KAI7821192.1 hypothetical protein BC939DRAFT_494164 [Gamsiella multidivaricata]